MVGVAVHMVTTQPAAPQNRDTGENGVNGREFGLTKTAWLQAVEEGHKRRDLELPSSQELKS
eukprot:12938813-Prorocentrum_lima.AAC.1